MPDIWERMAQLVPDGLLSHNEPVIAYIPASMQELVHQAVPLGTMKVKIGMTKILSCWMLMLGVLQLDANDRALLNPMLQTLGKIHATWDGNANLSEAVYQAIGYKMCRSLTQRVDPGQLLDAFAPIMAAKKSEQPHLCDDQLLDHCCNDYNMTQAVDGAKIDYYERKVTKWIHTQLSEAKDIIKLAWCPLAASHLLHAHLHS